MDKGTKLKLKRKLKSPRLNVIEEISKTESDSISGSIAHPGVEEFVVLTSESDDEVPQDKQKKIFQATGNEPESLHSSKSKRHFLDVKDIELRKLRELIMKVSGNTSTQKMASFPPHLSKSVDQPIDSGEIIKEGPPSLDTLVQERINYDISEPINGKKLSPFPSMCDWCRRRKASNEKCHKKPGHSDKDNQNVGYREAIFNGNSAKVDTDNCATNFKTDNVPLKENTTQVLDKHANAAKQDKKYIGREDLETDVVSNQRNPLLGNNSETNNSHLMRDRNSNYYSLQSRNGHSATACSSGRQTNELAGDQRNDLKNTAHGGGRQTSITAENQRNDLKNTAHGGGRQTSITAENQRNDLKNTAHSSGRQTIITAENQSSNLKNTAHTSLSKTFNHEKQLKLVLDADKEDLKGDEMEDQDVTTFNLAFDSDSDIEMTEIESEHNSGVDHTGDIDKCYQNDSDQMNHLKLVSKPRHLTNYAVNQKVLRYFDQEQQSDLVSKSRHRISHSVNKKVQNDAEQGFASELVSKPKQQAQERLKSKSLDACLRPTETRNVPDSDITNAQASAETVSNTERTSNKIPVACVSPCISSRKQTHSVRNCPLCQMEFTHSTSQLEIDGHIAACLSAADDDIVW